MEACAAASFSDPLANAFSSAAALSRAVWPVATSRPNAGAAALNSRLIPSRIVLSEATSPDSAHLPKVAKESRSHDERTGLPITLSGDLRWWRCCSDRKASISPELRSDKRGQLTPSVLCASWIRRPHASISWSYVVNTRGIPREAASASSEWRSQSRLPNAGSKLSRFSREAATSKGLRIGRNANGLTALRSNTSSQNGRRRQILGSLSANSRDDPNSSDRSSDASSRNSSAFGESNQFGLNSSQSFQADPADSSIRSLSLQIASDSQCPASFVGLAGIRVLGRSQPSRFSTRVSADVPERCMPRTRMAVRRLSGAVPRGSARLLGSNCVAWVDCGVTAFFDFDVAMWCSL